MSPLDWKATLRNSRRFSKEILERFGKDFGKIWKDLEKIWKDLERFWKDLERILERFGKILERFGKDFGKIWKDFEKIWKGFWKDFGKILERQADFAPPLQIAKLAISFNSR
jgi:phage-related tail protein